MFLGFSASFHKSRTQWKFRGGLRSDYDSNFLLDGQHDAQNESGIGTAFPGFNWTAVLRPDRVHAVLSTLAGESTGVKLSVQLRVTPGGLVQMQIEQEVSTISETNNSSLNSPTSRPADSAAM